MQSFIRNRGGASNPQTHPRAAAAANAKVQVKRTPLSHQEPVQQHSPGLGPSGGYSNPPVAQQQPQHRRQGQGHGAQQNRDVYDTDAESLDTTVHNQSVVQVQDSQNTEYQFAQVSGDEEEEYDDEEDEEGDDDEEGESEDYQEVVYGLTNGQLIERQGLSNAAPELQKKFLRQLRAEQQQDMFGGDESYPPTTSGVPSDFPQSFNRDQEPASDDIVDQSMLPPSPLRPAVKDQPLHPAAEQSFQRPLSASEAKSPMQKQPQVIQQAAALRGHHRPDANITMRAGVPHQSHVAPFPSSQLPLYSQASRQADLTPPVNTHHNIRTQVDQSLPQRGARQLAGPTQFQPAKPIERAAPSKHPIPPQPKEVTVFHHRPVEESPIHHPGPSPALDYDRPALFEMRYEQLRNEDFDTDPRADAPVLSEDMLQKSLGERLEHVKESLDAADQEKFFSSLPTNEWEEAGDWFIDKFSSIILRMKDGRKEKRKLAKGFEDEVEKRHQHVAKKQHQVEDAMKKMKTQGQDLMPKSPMKRP